MKKVILFLLFNLIVNASILDFKTLKEAKEAYKAKDFLKAAKLYEKVDSQKAKFDAADALYKAGKFKEALGLLKSIHSQDLRFKKLYNMGNCYAKLRDFDKAIKAYKDALKIKKDRDAEFNLKLVEKLKNQKKNKNSKQNNQNRQNKQKSQNKNNKKSKQKQNENQNKKESKQKRDSQKKRSKKHSQQKENRKTKAMQKQNMKFKKKNEPISDMEVRKWNKLLNQRGVRTLLLPLPTKSTGEKNEKNPW